jgi:hypothetical protein
MQKGLILGVLVLVLSISAGVYAQGPGMMGGYGYGPGMGPGMMGPGMMGPGWRGGYGMGPGMWGGGYGMGPGMMGGGYGYGQGMGPGWGRNYGYGQSEECQKYFNETAGMRKELNDKRFNYFEALRNPKTKPEEAGKLEKEIWELHQKIASKVPAACW